MPPARARNPRGWISAPRSRRPDKAPESGDPRPLLSPIKEKVHEGIHRYYTVAREPRGHAKDSAEAGRACVQACVPYLRSVERLGNDAVAPIARGGGEGGHSGPAGHQEPRVH